MGNIVTEKKLLPLESLRGIAAISVVIHHLRIGSHFNNQFTDHAWLMVDFFFVLSGFVMALRYRDRLSSTSDLVSFQVRRFWRLYPLHLLMLLVFLCIEFAKFGVEVGFDKSAMSPAFTKNDVIAFYANILLIHNWTLPDLTYNFPSWSISAEFYVYAIFGVAALACRKSRWALTGFAFLLTALALSALSTRSMGVSNIDGPLRCIYGFFLGVIVEHIYRLCSGIKLETSLAGLTSLAVSVVAIMLLGGQKSGLVVLAPITFAISILLIAITPRETVLSSVLSHKWLVYLGTISYGVYMIHAAIWWAVTQAMRFVFDVPNAIDDEGKVVIYMENPLIADATMLGGLALIILLAHFSYVYFERAFYRSNTSSSNSRTATNRVLNPAE